MNINCKFQFSEKHEDDIEQDNSAVKSRLKRAEWAE